MSGITYEKDKKIWYNKHTINFYLSNQKRGDYSGLSPNNETAFV